MIAMTPDNPTLAYSNPAYVTSVDHGSGVEVFSRKAVDREWDRWTDWLRKLYRDPHSVADGYQSAPPREVLEVALRLLDTLRSGHQQHPPTSVRLEPSGGVVIERSDSGRVVEFILWDDGDIQGATYENGQLVQEVSLR